MNVLFATPQEAEAAFYDAFQRRDLADMMRVWADDDHIVCIHPGSDRLEGTAQIRQSWRYLFAAGAAMRFELSDEQYTQGEMLAIHLLRENIDVDGERQGSVLTTNIYQLVKGGWRMILHHASPSLVAEPDEAPPGEQEVLH